MSFTKLNLGKSLQNALIDMELTAPTAIQSKSFAPIMSGKDVVGIAQTGTGKTFAYLLPSLRLWKFTKSPFPQVLIIVPTRELVVQVLEEVEKLAVYMNVEAAGVYGGTNMRTQKAEISLGVDVVIGTPGRLVDLMKDCVLKTKDIKRLIIDEVDEMLNLGFRTQLKNIIDFLPGKRQNLMFSATITDEVELVIDQFTNFYEKIEAAPSGAPLENIDQSYYSVPNFNTKANLLDHLLSSSESMSKVLVFVSTKKYANALYEKMESIYGETVGVIHSSKSQNNRFDTVRKFQSGEYRFLITTDIIARGLDVFGVTHVINFDLPDVSEKYIHRIGRTGRAEEKGIAMSFVSDEHVVYRESIEALMKLSILKVALPEEVKLSEELIQLEIPEEFVPFNNHKMKEFKPSGDAFHEKSDKNKKVNYKERYEDKMMKKYGKPIRRKPKQK